MPGAGSLRVNAPRDARDSLLGPANSLLKTTFRALRNISLCPWKIGDIVAAALVILHIDRERTT